MAVPPQERAAAPARPGLVQRRAAAAIGSLLATIEGTEADEAAETAVLDRPQRWDSPFDPEMSYSDVIWLLQRPELRDIDADKFPSRIPLTGILRNDARIVRCEAGDIVVREGDYGNSAFLVLEGKLRVVVAPSLPRNVLGRQRVQKRGFFEALTQLWTNKLVPEVRDVAQYSGEAHRTDDSGRTRVFLQDFSTVLDKHRTAELGEGALFGELAALGRTPRTATVFAESAATLLEIRWQGLRELRTYDVNWRRRIDENYRKNALQSHLKAVDLFSGLSEDAIAKIGETTIFETFGGFDWSVSYKKGAKARGEGKADGFGDEPLIVREGDYTDGLLLIRAGFARVSVTFGNSERTLTYLGAGDIFGLHELYESWRSKEQVPAETTIRALGYVDVLRVPTRVLEEQVFPHNAVKPQRFAALAERPVAEDGLLEWSVRERFINGTKAMLIDLERCVRCDDCVRACASTHGGNPRFVRHGKTFDHWMVTNACMHCADPVCLIGCPTGAIHRSEAGGAVVINDTTCIGCGTCAESCPYNNIRLVEIADVEGRPVTDPKTGRPIFKATKCDLCSEQPGGPACVRACPHDALSRVNF